MGSAFRLLYPRYIGTLTPTAPMAVRLQETFTLNFFLLVKKIYIDCTDVPQLFPLEDVYWTSISNFDLSCTVFESRGI